MPTGHHPGEHVQGIGRADIGRRERQRGEVFLDLLAERFARSMASISGGSSVHPTSSRVRPPVRTKPSMPRAVSARAPALKYPVSRS